MLAAFKEILFGFIVGVGFGNLVFEALEGNFVRELFFVELVHNAMDECTVIGAEVGLAWLTDDITAQKGIRTIVAQVNECIEPSWREPIVLDVRLEEVSLDRVTWNI